jgi:4-amino-4-deoxy-L-arabinose transferase-like glycosyltransferase
VTSFPDSNHHPLYSVLAHAAVSVFGERPWVVRLPAVLFGIATIPAVYLLGVRVASRREGLFAAALLAASYHHVWFSQNARGYTALAFWTVLTTLALWRGLRGGDGPWPVTYGIAAGLGLYTHLTMVFTVGAHAIVCAWLLVWPRARPQPRIAWSRVAGAFGLGAILATALTAPIAPEMYDFYTSTPRDAARVGTYRWALLETLRGLELGLGAWGVLAAALLGSLGLLSYARQSRVLSAMMIVPGLLAAVAVAVLQWPMRPRFFFFLIGFAAMILARGAVVAGDLSARRWAPARGALAGGLVAALLAASLLSLPYGYRHPKQDFGGAMQFVEASRGRQDAVATAGAASLPYREYYGRSWASLERAEQLQRLAAQAPRLWLLYTFPEYIEVSAPDLMRTIRRDCTTVRTFRGTVGGGDVVVATCRAASSPL